MRDACRRVGASASMPVTSIVAAVSPLVTSLAATAPPAFSNAAASAVSPRRGRRRGCGSPAFPRREQFDDAARLALEARRGNGAGDLAAGRRVERGGGPGERRALGGKDDKGAGGGGNDRGKVDMHGNSLDGRRSIAGAAVAQTAAQAAALRLASLPPGP